MEAVRHTERAHARAAVAAKPAPVSAKAKAEKAAVAAKLKKTALKNQIVFRYRLRETAFGVTRETAQALAQALGVDETHMLHLAVRKLAAETLPQYEADNGALTASQLVEIKKVVPQGTKRSVRSSLFGTVAA